MKNNTPPKWKPKERVCSVCSSVFLAKNPNTRKCDICHTEHCPVCDKEFRKVRSDQNFCSGKCARKYHRKRKSLTCEYCGKVFFPLSGHLGQKFCSKTCGYQNRRIDEIDHKRNSAKYRTWRRRVFQRDNYTCQVCGETNNLQSHHIKEWSDYPELRYEIDNGKTLCSSCHSKIHNRTINRTCTKKLICENCGATIGGKGKSNYCKSCSLKLSPKAKESRLNRLRNQSGQYS